MTKNENLEQEIRNVFLEVFPDLSEYDFSWKKHQKEYKNWDSFAQLHLVSLAELKFSVTLSIDETTSIASAHDLLERIKAHL